ncbi:Uncharacterized protein HZ326_26925 [Fusarium oxysporum f. sp. albedinis]|nr:Uncharacterized protein HZ326_26925 [Fusarium oxysporum f. sp. albedinis]
MTVHVNRGLCQKVSGDEPNALEMTENDLLPHAIEISPDSSLSAKQQKDERHRLASAPKTSRPSATRRSRTVAKKPDSRGSARGKDSFWVKNGKDHPGMPTVPLKTDRGLESLERQRGHQFTISLQFSALIFYLHIMSLPVSISYRFQSLCQESRSPGTVITHNSICGKLKIEIEFTQQYLSSPGPWKGLLVARMRLE